MLVTQTSCIFSKPHKFQNYRTCVCFVSCYEIFQFIKKRQKREILLISPGDFTRFCPYNLPTEICMVLVLSGLSLAFQKRQLKCQLSKSQIHVFECLQKSYRHEHTHRKKNIDWRTTKNSLLSRARTRTAAESQCAYASRRICWRTPVFIFSNMQTLCFFEELSPPWRTWLSYFRGLDQYWRKCWYFGKNTF